MRKTALITGASKGIGRELAHFFAKDECDLVLVARSEEELNSLKVELEEKCRIKVHILIKDLCQPYSAQEIFDELKAISIDIDFLVNNAGFGDYGSFDKTDWDTYENMISLNVTTLTHFCHIFIKDWKGRKPGKILNVSSTAAFQPGPMMAVYFATKAYVLSFSEAIGHELRNDNITVTTLCPGPTSTHFGVISSMNASDLVKNVKIANSKDVAELGFRAMMKGKATVIHGAQNKIAPFGIRFLPRIWVTHLSAKIMGKNA